MKKYAKIKGMSCEHCVARVTNALNEIDGISYVKVNLKKGIAVFDADEDVKNQEIIDAIEDAGYEIKEVDWE